MTETNEHLANVWKDSEFARSWAEKDAMRSLLELPRRIAIEVIADDNPRVARVIDIGSGPGDFLAVALTKFSKARGLWADVSPAMLEIARSRLEVFTGRLDYQILDMTDLACLPDEVDAIITSRATHHLSTADLDEFYGQVARHLKDGGWLVNLDHVGTSSAWSARLRAVRRRLNGASVESPKHEHQNPLPSCEAHLNGLVRAGINDVQVVWRAYSTCLFMARTC